jgi:hypothetical protein
VRRGIDKRFSLFYLLFRKKAMGKISKLIFQKGVSMKIQDLNLKFSAIIQSQRVSITFDPQNPPKNFGNCGKITKTN